MPAEIRLQPGPLIKSDAEFSHDGRNRYWLSRPAAGSGSVGLIVGLNPSKAGADIKDTDHTITKEIEFAGRWGWSGFWKGNLFSIIETESHKLKGLDYDTCVGPWNDDVLAALATNCDDIVVAWGNNVPRLKRIRISVVMGILRRSNPNARFRCFGLSKEGNPVHPLRLAYSTPLVDFGGVNG